MNRVHARGAIRQKAGVRGRVRPSVAGRGVAIGLLLVVVGLLAAQPVPGPAAPPGPVVTSPQPPPPAAGTLWAADMEEESLRDWDLDDVGGEFNSGIADAAASRDVAYNGLWSAKLTIATPPESGTRLFRWGEPRSNRDLYYEAWFYIPRRYQLTGDPFTGRYWDIFQFKSTSEDGSRNDPIWFLSIDTDSRGAMTPALVWWHKTLEGPHQDESGFRRYANREVTVPVGRWFQVTARLRQSKDFDGLVQFWLDGRQIFDLTDVRTGHVSCTYNAWCVDQAWSVNLYSDGLSPSPTVMYVDAARIKRVGQ